MARWRNPFDDEDEPSAPAPILTAIGVAIGIIVLIGVISLAPGLGSTIQVAAPVPGPSSAWNNSCRTAEGVVLIQGGAEFFAENIQFVVLLVIVTIIGIVLSYLVSTGRPRQ